MFCLVQQQSWKKKAATAATAHCTDRFKSKLLNQLNQSLYFKLWPSTFIYVFYYLYHFISESLYVFILFIKLSDLQARFAISICRTRATQLSTQKRSSLHWRCRIKCSNRQTGEKLPKCKMI
jgi:hypothetical protein